MQQYLLKLLAQTHFVRQKKLQDCHIILKIAPLNF